MREVNFLSGSAPELQHNSILIQTEFQRIVIDGIGDPVVLQKLLKLRWVSLETSLTVTWSYTRTCEPYDFWRKKVIYVSLFGTQFEIFVHKLIHYYFYLFVVLVLRYLDKYQRRRSQSSRWSSHANFTIRCFSTPSRLVWSRLWVTVMAKWQTSKFFYF
jgi:hypothetical protein